LVIQINLHHNYSLLFVIIERTLCIFYVWGRFWMLNGCSFLFWFGFLSFDFSSCVLLVWKFPFLVHYLLLSYDTIVCVPFLSFSHYLPVLCFKKMNRVSLMLFFVDVLILHQILGLPFQVVPKIWSRTCYELIPKKGSWQLKFLVSSTFL